MDPIMGAMLVGSLMGGGGDKTQTSQTVTQSQSVGISNANTANVNPIMSITGSGAIAPYSVPSTGSVSGGEASASATASPLQQIAPEGTPAPYLPMFGGGSAMTMGDLDEYPSNQASGGNLMKNPLLWAGIVGIAGLAYWGIK